MKKGGASVNVIRNAYGDANTLNALNTMNFTEIFNGSHTPAESTSESYMYLTGQGGDASNGGVQIAVGAYPSTNDKIFYRRYNGGSWGSWKQIYGITTGTPTSLNTNLTWWYSPATSVPGATSQCYCLKSGNVVTFRLMVTAASAFTASELTVVCKMPWTNAGIVECVRSNGTCIIYNGNLCWGKSESVSVGTQVSFAGTYLTND